MRVVAVALVAVGACRGTSSASRLPAGVDRHPGWTDAQLKGAYGDWTDDMAGQTQDGHAVSADGDAGDDDGGGGASGNADRPGDADAREGRLEARRVLLLCEFNTATLYVTYAQFQAMSVGQRRDLSESVRHACLA